MGQTLKDDSSSSSLRNKQQPAVGATATEEDFKGPTPLPLDWNEYQGLNLKFTRPRMGSGKAIDREYKLRFTDDGRLEGQAISETRKNPFPVKIPKEKVVAFREHLANVTMFEAMYSNEFDPTRQDPSVYHPHYLKRGADAMYRFRFEGKTLETDVEIYTKSHMACHKDERVCGRFPWVVRFRNFQNPLSSEPTRHWIVMSHKFDDAWDEIEIYFRG